MVMLIVGEPGIGKTTLAMAAKNPILFDFDLGAERTAFRSAVVARPENYSELLAFVQSPEFKEYSTVVFDTAGAFVDRILFAHVRTNSPKYYDFDAGMPNQKGWGIVGNCFKEIFNICKFAGVDIIFIAHEKKEQAKKGDIPKSIPKIQGQALAVILEACSQVGLMYSHNGNRILDFKQDQTQTTKDSAGIGTVTIETFAADSPSRQFQSLIQNCKKRISENANRHTEAAAETVEIRRLIKLVKDPESATMLAERISNFKNGITTQLKLELIEFAKTVNLKCDAKIAEDGTKYGEWSYATPVEN